jgi:hypothetical protein
MEFVKDNKLPRWLLPIEDLSHSYDHGRRILVHISFWVKTCFLRIIVFIEYDRIYIRRGTDFAPEFLGNLPLACM